MASWLIIPSRAFFTASFWLAVTFAAGADLSEKYSWKPLKIGGGGWVTGLDASAAERGLLYVRTDVSGAYRWDVASATWKQVVTTASMPAGALTYGNYGGVDSLVAAPGDPRIAYLAFAGKPYGGAVGQIYRSTDRGTTWTATRFAEHKVLMEPNGPNRQSGERLAVDPQNSDIVYFGSLSNGLWTTSDAGNTWSKVPAVPAGKPKYGVQCITFDRGGGTTEVANRTRRTNVIYATVEQEGVFQSVDAGVTWKRISETGPGQAGKPRDAAIGGDRTFYVTYDNEGGATGAVWKYSAAGVWTEITPASPAGGSKAYWSLAVHPVDANKIVAMLHGGICFVSNDQGKTWTRHGFRLKSSQIRWLGEQKNYFLSMGEIAFDPFEPDKLWFAEGFGVWWTKDLKTDEIEWHAASEGIEESCGNDVISPHGGKLVVGAWDLGAFAISDPDQYTARKSHPGFMSCWALDWCAADPSFVVGVFRSHLDVVKQPNSSGFSTDGGQTWTRFAALDQGTSPKELEYGVIAVSAHNRDKIVWAPTHGKGPHFTSDRGVTWKPCTLEGGNTTGHHAHFAALKPLCADRVLADTFYLYTPQAGLLRSTDGGANFRKVGSPVDNRWNLTLKSTPGMAGHLWFADGAGRGVWRSKDGGATWTELPGLQQAVTLGLGKPLIKEGYPTLFVAGTKDGSTGIYRSTDEGQTWDKITAAPLGITDWIDALEGDKEVFGKVYVAFAGAGFAYGQLTRE